MYFSGIKKRQGFTLIELLVVIAIIGLLSTIISAPIQSARKKAKDAKKIAEIKAVQLALDQYADGNRGQYPSAIDDLAPQYLPVLPMYSIPVNGNSSPDRDGFAYSYYTGAALGSASTTFGYHIGVKLDTYGAALESDRDCAGASIGSVLEPTRCVVFNGYIDVRRQDAVRRNTKVSAIQATSSPDIGIGTTFPFIGVLVEGSDFVGNPLGASASSTAEPTTSTCVGNSDCVFDVTGQQ